MTDSMTEFPPKPNTDYEKEAIRDEIMTMKGEVKLLHQQNRDLLNKLNTAVIFTILTYFYSGFNYIFFLF